MIFSLILLVANLLSGFLNLEVQRAGLACLNFFVAGFLFCLVLILLGGKP
jgi:hypothetical protein